MEDQPNPADRQQKGRIANEPAVDELITEDRPQQESAKVRDVMPAVLRFNKDGTPYDELIRLP